MARIKILAHRGLSSLYPENSLIAFQKAIELGADGIECDLRTSADGHIVLMHDATVDRTTDGSGEVCDMTLLQLRRHRLRGPTAGGGKTVWKDQTIPTLIELFELFNPTDRELRLEVKQVGLEGKLIETIRSFGLAERVTVTSFFACVPKAVKDIDPAIRTGWIAGKFDARQYEQVRPHVDAIDLALTADLTDQVAKRVKGDGLIFDVWTVNSVEQFTQAVSLGPDYLTSDYPQRMMALLKKHVPHWAKEAT